MRNIRTISGKDHYGREVIYPITCYEKLGNAVVIQAVRDYKDAKMRLYKNPANRNAQDELCLLKRFFFSKLFTVYTSLDGEQLWDTMEKELEIKSRSSSKKTAKKVS